MIFGGISEVKKNRYKSEVYKSLALITQFGINMIVPIFLCMFIGIFLDRKLGTSYIVIIMFFLGAAAGARNVYMFAKGIYDNPKDRDKRISVSMDTPGDVLKKDTNHTNDI